jgi:photosystem II stability/assembly factor-like uncharacterized protein
MSKTFSLKNYLRGSLCHLLPACVSLLLGFANAMAQQPRSPLESSYDAYAKMKASSLFNLAWVPLGPTVNSARADVVQADPTHPGTLYVGFGSGGLWKTINNGVSWFPVFENQSSLGIGDAELAPSDPSVIYVGTGENLKKPRNFTLPGTGMFRSGDGGKTWQHIGLEDSWSIAEIAIHPKDPNTVLVAVLGHLWSGNKNRGLFRTTNGGKTWQQVLYKDESTGANDVVISPSDPHVMYASLWEVHPGISGSNSGVYRSNDAGKTWAPVSSGLPIGPKLGRIGLAVSHKDPQKAYALVDNLANPKEEAAELYKTTNGGKSWVKTHAKPFMIFPGIGWYFTDIYLDPTNDEEVYCLGVRLAHSSDGGKTFNYIGGKVNHMTPSAAQGLHLDQTELWIDPTNPRHLLLGNDGGIYGSYDKGNSWTHYNNIPTGEFYDLTIDQSRYVIYGGTQDDATVYGPATELNTDFPDPWKYLWIDPWDGGDGCVTQVDPKDDNTVYYSMQHGAAVRLDRKMDTTASIKPSLPEGSRDTLRFNYIAPYFISPHASGVLYHGGNFIFKSTAHGDNWTVISPDLSISSMPAKRSVAAGAVVESKVEKGLLYAGMDKGACWMSPNDGKDWREISTGLANRYIRSICPSQFDKNRVYLAMTGINEDDLHAYLYLSEDQGKTWKTITSGLPDDPVNVILEDAVHEDILYAGGLRGVYVSVDRGTTWSTLGLDMPQAAVADLEIHEPSMDLVVATHGRGMYRINLKPIHAMVEGKWGTDADQLMEIPSGERPWFNSAGGEPDKRTIKKTPISFWLSGSEAVSLVLLDADGKEIWHTDLQGVKGFNTYRWDLVVKRQDSDLPYFIEYEKFLPAGMYQMVLKGGKAALSRPFVVTSSPSPYRK